MDGHCVFFHVYQSHHQYVRLAPHIVGIACSVLIIFVPIPRGISCIVYCPPSDSFFSSSQNGKEDPEVGPFSVFKLRKKCRRYTVYSIQDIEPSISFSKCPRNQVASHALCPVATFGSSLDTVLCRFVRIIIRSFELFSGLVKSISESNILSW